MKLKKGDTVQIVKGKDKGKTGTIEKVVIGKVLIPEINMVKRHVKRRLEKQRSEIVTIPMPLPLASVMLVCPQCKLKTRVGFRLEDKKKVRICKKCEREV